MKIPASLYWRTKFMLWFKPIYKSLGDFESWLLKSELKSTKIIKPIYITSLARSGTTIITEILSKGENICSHTYADFPSVFTPYWKNWLRQKQKFLAGKKVERTHSDRIMINNDSPDAFEEVIWMYFFPQIHGKDSHKTQFSENNQFIKYYHDNIKKHLLVKNKSRYIAKANYNISRIEALLKISPDAKFIIPIRHPINHIASLVKQHNIYLKAAKDNQKIDGQLAASGHFEFGNNRQIINMPGSDYSDKVAELWQHNKEVQGWAHYWQGLYASIDELKHKNPQLNEAIQIFKYEELCHNSEQTIDDIINHCQLEEADFLKIKKSYDKELSLPNYYKIPFNTDEINEILNITQTVSEKFGYNADNYN